VKNYKAYMVNLLISGLLTCVKYVKQQVNKIYCSYKSSTSHLGTQAPIVRLGVRGRSTDITFQGAFSCLQLYGKFMTYGEISKAQQLCRPACRYSQIYL